jgi:uncharacterized protein YjiS (DUF1127 family)
MSTINGTTELGLPAAKRQYYSPLEAYWDIFWAWRKRERRRTELRRLTDDELMDIGLTRGEIDYIVSNQLIDPTAPHSS